MLIQLLYFGLLYFVSDVTYLFCLFSCSKAQVQPQIRSLFQRVMQTCGHSSLKDWFLSLEMDYLEVNKESLAKIWGGFIPRLRFLTSSSLSPAAPGMASVIPASTPVVLSQAAQVYHPIIISQPAVQVGSVLMWRLWGEKMLLECDFCLCWIQMFIRVFPPPSPTSQTHPLAVAVQQAASVCTTSLTTPASSTVAATICAGSTANTTGERS